MAMVRAHHWGASVNEGCSLNICPDTKFLAFSQEAKKKPPATFLPETPDPLRKWSNQTPLRENSSHVIAVWL
jgi:hypothetical protein